MVLDEFPKTTVSEQSYAEKATPKSSWYKQKKKKTLNGHASRFKLMFEGGQFKYYGYSAWHICLCGFVFILFDSAQIFVSRIVLYW